MALDIAPFASLKSLLGLTKDALSDYPQLEEIVNRAWQGIETYLGYQLDLNDYSLSFFQHNPTKYIYLDALPVAQVYSLLVDGVEYSDYQITPYGLILGASISNVPITVSWEAGYDDETYPPVIKEAALIQVCYEYGMVDNIGATVTTTDGGTVSRPELGLLKEVKRMLTKYQSPSQSVVA